MMRLKAQDILLSLKLLNDDKLRLTYKQLAGEIGMSVSETHQALHRAQAAGLISPVDRNPRRSALAELLIHGLKYMIPTQPERRTRGLVTGFAAPPLLEHFKSSVDDGDAQVWPDPNGQTAGWAIEPLVSCVPFAAQNDNDLYEWLVLADVLRGAGRARERKIAEDIVRQRLGYYAAC